jgi:Tfp pilus assembly protein PilO
MAMKFSKDMVFPASVLAGFLILVIAALSICLPIVGAISKAKEEKQAYDQELTFAHEILASKYTAKTSAQLVSTKQVVMVMDELTKLGKKHDLEIVSLKNAGVSNKKDGFYKGILFELESSSSFKDLGLFLSSVKEMPDWIMDLDSLKVTPDPADPSQVNAKITFTLFVSKDNG